MAGKKKKALAQDLIDDLLSEEASDSAPDLELTKGSRVAEAPAGLAIAPREFDGGTGIALDLGEAEDSGNTDVLNGSELAALADDSEIDSTEVSNSTEVSDPLPAMELGASEDGGDESTMKIPETARANATMVVAAPPPAPSPKAPASARTPAAEKANHEVRASVGRYAPSRAIGSSSSSTEAALAQSESLRIAQNRLLEFEQEIERLRTQNEELAAAGETLRRRTDELTAENQKRDSDYQYAVSGFEQEKKILNDSKDALQRDLDAHKQKADELELRISSNIQKIRVRERELENRLELVRMESAALIRSKDEMILDLKRQIDTLNIELNNYRNKNQELNRQTNDKQEMLRRTVKALRLALSMLEGEEENQASPQRKAK